MQSLRELWHANQVEWLHEVTLTESWGKNKKKYQIILLGMISMSTWMPTEYAEHHGILD